jgi:hypothetical protein
MEIGLLLHKIRPLKILFVMEMVASMSQISFNPPSGAMDFAASFALVLIEGHVFRRASGAGQ